MIFWQNFGKKSPKNKKGASVLHANPLNFIGGPYWNRTNNLLIKSQLLCLVELTARQGSFGINFDHGCQIIFGRKLIGITIYLFACAVGGALSSSLALCASWRGLFCGCPGRTGLDRARMCRLHGGTLSRVPPVVWRQPVFPSAAAGR